MKIKMIVTDLDGTLLKTDKTISAYTKDTLAHYRALGTKVVYATGRGSDGTQFLHTLFDAQIHMNGAIATVDEQIIYERLIPYETARDFLMACDEKGLQVTSQSKDTHYSNFVVSHVWPWIDNFEIVDFATHAIDAQKIYLTRLTPTDLDFIQSILPDELYMVMANDGLLMIMHTEATKWSAISAVADYFGIDPSEIVAFGDDLNDIDMLSHAGISVAMANASHEVKSIGRHICDSNDDDGVARWLEAHATPIVCHTNN